MLRGIDISNWQAGLILSTLDIDFCIAKATEGNYFVDYCCDGFIRGAKALGLKWGFYHFANDNDPIVECDYFLANTKGYDGEGIPVLDYEVWGQNADVSWCEKFLMHYHDMRDVYPLLYISAAHCADFRGSWIPEKCGLWVAGYPHDARTWVNPDSMPYDIAPWKFAALWQFTSGLVLENKPLDGDFAYMDEKAWDKYAHGDKKGKKADTPILPNKPVKTCEQLADEVIAGKWGTGSERQKKLDSVFGEGTYKHVQAIVNRKLGK